MATAGDLLSDDDVPEIVRQIFLVRNESGTLGRILKLPKATVDSIHRQYSKPKDCLFHVIDEFVKQLEPRPTWEVIVDALRNPLIDLPRLALELEEKYCFHDGPTTCCGKQTSQGTLTSPERPKSANSLRSSSREDFQTVSSGTHHKIDPVKRLHGIPDPLIVTTSGGRLLSVILARTSEEVRKMIDELDKGFNSLKKNIRDTLERTRVLVKDVADVLTSLSPDDDEHHRMFLEGHVEKLYTAVNHSVLFGTMNFHWNYLDPSLLDTLVKKLDLKEVKVQMDGYKSALQGFRMKTPLSLFCRAQKRKRIKISPEFHEVVAHFTWPEEDVITLEAVEVFRQEYASHFNLREFAMMLAQVRPGSFVVIWFVPKSVVDTLKGVVPRTILIKSFVTSLKVAGTCVYCIHKETTPDDVLPSCCLACSESDSCEQRVLPEEEQSALNVETSADPAPDSTQTPNNMLPLSTSVEYSAPQQEDTVSGSTETSQEEGERGEGLVEVTPFLDPTSTTETAVGSTEQSQEEEGQTEQSLVVTQFLNLTSIDSEIAVSLAGGVPAGETVTVTEELKAKYARIPASPERSDTDDPSFGYAPESSIFIRHSLPVEVPFLEEPSQDFSCPVTYSLMLTPHVTSCCGQNLSREAATRIRRGGGACPLCRASQWSTALNKELQRQVRGLRVFCCHEDRGCVWRGQLYEFDRHVRSCSMKDAPLLGQLLKSTEVPQGRTELHDAAKRGDVEEVKRLLSSPVNINSRTIITGETALHLASERGHVKVVGLIVNAQADLNIADKNGRTPLYWAAVRGYKAVVEILLNNGADVHICRKDGKTPLICASLRGHVAVVRLLLEKGATVNGCDKGGHSPAFAASQNGHTDVVDLLVQAGADIHLATTESGNVPLMIAAQEGHTGTVQRLLDAGATINYQNKDGKTPLICASLRGHVEVVRLLLEKGAGINICEKDGVSPLFAASWKGHAEVVDVLLQAQANSHLATTEHGNNALGIAARKGHTVTVHSLLEAGANINYQNKIDTTALHQAAMNGHSEVVKLLLRAGASDIPDKTGRTALDKARANAHMDVVHLLYMYNRTVTLL